MEEVYLEIDVILDAVYEVGTSGKAAMVLFHGECKGPLFCGRILPGAVDTQLAGRDGSVSLSARYIIEGKDCSGAAARLFIQNEGIQRNGEELITTPVILTDSTELAWLERTACEGRIDSIGNGIRITIKKKDAPPLPAER